MLWSKVLLLYYIIIQQTFNFSLSNILPSVSKWPYFATQWITGSNSLLKTIYWNNFIHNQNCCIRRKYFQSSRDHGHWPERTKSTSESTESDPSTITELLTNCTQSYQLFPWKRKLWHWSNLNFAAILTGGTPLVSAICNELAVTSSSQGCLPTTTNAVWKQLVVL